MYAARAIAVGEGDIYIAGGTESMTRAPFVMANRKGNFHEVLWSFRIQQLAGALQIKNLEEMYGADSMPETAENVAQRFNFTRKNKINLRSKPAKGKKAMENKRFANEIVPVDLEIEKAMKSLSIKMSILVQTRRLKNWLN